MEVNWNFNRTMERVELGLSFGAPIPVLGIVCGVTKVAMGALQMLVAFVVSFYARFQQDEGLATFTLVHLQHGLYNICAGAFEAIPVVGSLLYLLRLRQQPTGEEYQIITGHEMQFLPYRHLELSDARVRLPSAQPGTGMSLWMAIQGQLVEAVKDVDAETKLQKIPFTATWTSMTKQEKEWVVSFCEMMYEPGACDPEDGVSRPRVRENVDFEPLFPQNGGLTLKTIISLLAKISLMGPADLFKMGQDSEMTLLKLAQTRKDEAALEEIRKWVEARTKSNAAAPAEDTTTSTDTPPFPHIHQDSQELQTS